MAAAVTELPEPLMSEPALLRPVFSPGLTSLARGLSCGLLNPVCTRWHPESTEPWGGVVQAAPPPRSWKSRVPGGSAGRGCYRKTTAGRQEALLSWLPPHSSRKVPPLPCSWIPDGPSPSLDKWNVLSTLVKVLESWSGVCWAPKRTGLCMIQAQSKASERPRLPHSSISWMALAWRLHRPSTPRHREAFSSHMLVDPPSGVVQGPAK